MKFRQFEFRLFPKIRNRKRKKSKFGHPDYPRDISRDKNCNLYKKDFPCFYDNLAAEANPVCYNAECEYLLSEGNVTEFDTYDSSNTDIHSIKTLPLTESNTCINIEGKCHCPLCACATKYPPSQQTSGQVSAGMCSGASLGTPNTVPRTRTRIKTNPWLPSPRSTPYSSPTDQERQLVAHQAISDQDDNLYIARPSSLPLISSYGAIHQSKMKTLTMSLNGLAGIPEDGLREAEENIIIHSNITSPEKSEYYYETIPKSSRQYSLKEDPNYETDISNCSSPVNEFLKCVKYEISFAYEENADDLLENSTFPRDDSFTSGIFKYSESPETGPEDEAERTNYQSKLEDEEFTFDDTNNNMQESIDTGYGSVSRDSDFMSSDDEFGAKIEIGNDAETELRQPQDYHSIENCNGPKRDRIDECNSITVSRNENYDLDRTSDLEWDDEPITQTLILEFPHFSQPAREINSNNSLDFINDTSLFKSPMKRYGSVKYRRNIGDQSECTCHRRRSRSLADIELSLDEKVTLLREEKSYVQKKIHEAVLEEKVRQHQLKIFRLLAGDKRKQLIVETLHDLKSRLEDQSVRLQASYSTVLSLQNMFSNRNREQGPHEA